MTNDKSIRQTKTEQERISIKNLFAAVYLSFVICSLSFLLAGCAKTVTTLPVIGNQLSIEITFRGNIDTAANRYYVVFGNDFPKTPYTGSYFFAPGEVYDQNRLDVSTEASYYYTNYFSGWNDFILLKNNVFNITNGPFNNYLNHNSYLPALLSYRDSSSSDPNTAKKIVLKLDFSKLSALPAYLFFNFVAIDSQGRIRDYLRATDNKILVNKGTSINDIPEPQDLSIDASLDISSWKMTVE